MIRRISNIPLSYPWGSTHLIPDLIGSKETDAPISELWFGTHPASPSLVDTGESLKDLAGELGFLVKFLSAASPLSIQSHPNLEQARAGFENEQFLEIPIDDYSRNFKDANHKPELLIAISPFRVLSGFRPIAEINQELKEIASKDSHFESWAAGEKTLSQHFDFVFNELDPGLLDPLAEHSELVKFLSEFYPKDPGLGIAFLLNEIFLAPGEAVFLPAGNLHAYLQGLGVEVMASSDNVIRGGLTSKNVDIELLREITVFDSLNPKLGPKSLQQGLDEYEVSVDDFRVYRIEPSGSQLIADITLPEPGILVCVSGEIVVSNSLDEKLHLKKGEACYISNDARLISFSGAGTGYLATGS